MTQTLEQIEHLRRDESYNCVFGHELHLGRIEYKLVMVMSLRGNKKTLMATLLQTFPISFSACLFPNEK